MAPRRFVSLAGFIILIVGLFCPLISPLGLIKWNMFNLNMVFGIVILVIAITGLASALIEKLQLVKIIGWITLGLVLLVFIAAVLKVNTSFSFLPFPKIARYLSSQIFYRWGWYLLFAGPILVLLGSVNRKTTISRS